VLTGDYSVSSVPENADRSFPTKRIDDVLRKMARPGTVTTTAVPPQECWSWITWRRFWMHVRAFRAGRSSCTPGFHSHQLTYLIYDGRPSDEGVSAFGHCRATGFSRLGSTCRATMDRSGYAPGGARRAWGCDGLSSVVRSALSAGRADPRKRVNGSPGAHRTGEHAALPI